MSHRLFCIGAFDKYRYFLKKGKYRHWRGRIRLSEEYLVKLDAFEGPLDLLLHLIKQYEIDIYDIPLAEIADQYTTYIHTMKYLELNIASEYLVMAATLIELKSQMLLPNQTPDRKSTRLNSSHVSISYA